MERWRGTKALVQDAVDQGSRRLEQLQKETARKPFAWLARIAPLQVPVKGVAEIHDMAVSNTHAMVRLVNRVVGDTLTTVMDFVDDRDPRMGTGP